MLYASQEERDAWHSGAQKRLILEFSNGTVITNEDIDGEALQFEQTISEESQLIFGQVSSACLKVRVLGVTQKFKNLTVYAYMEMTSYEGEDYHRDIGHFKVVDDTATSDRLYRDLTCYDALYDVLPANYAEWYNSLTFPMTMKQFRDAFFNHIGIQQQKETIGQLIRDVSLVNDDMIIQRNFVADELSGAEMLKYICEINGVFGQIDYSGKFRYIRIRINLEGLYPANDLYPLEPGWYWDEEEQEEVWRGLYPRDPETYTFRGDAYMQGSLKYEEYECKPITSVQLRMEEGDVGVTTGSAGNLYIVENNPLLYGMKTSELTPIAENLLAVVRDVRYTPASFQSPASLWFELGDAFKLITDKDTVLVCILTRRLTGITRLLDNYECKGQEYYTENTGSTSKNILVLRQRTNVLERNVEETRSEITEVRTDLNNSVTTLRSEIKQSADQIQLTVAKTQKEWDLSGIPYNPNYTGHGTPAAAGYAASSYRNKYYMNLDNGAVYLSNGSTWVLQTAYSVSYFGYVDNPNTLGDAYLASKNNGKCYLNQTNGKLYQSNGTSWVYKRQCKTIQTTMQSQITQNANSINLKVSKGNVISQLNLEVKDGTSAVTISGNKISITSDYFSLTTTGAITATSGKIGTFNFDDKCMCTNTSNKNIGVFLSAVQSYVNSKKQTVNCYSTRTINNKTVNCLFAIGENKTGGITYFGLDLLGRLYASGVDLKGSLTTSSDNNKATTTITAGKIFVTGSKGSPYGYDQMKLEYEGEYIELGGKRIFNSEIGESADWSDIIDIARHYKEVKSNGTW